jgi:hypothetical protein
MDEVLFGHIYMHLFQFCGFLWVANDAVRGVSNRFNMEPQRWPCNSIVKV